MRIILFTNSPLAGIKVPGTGAPVQLQCCTRGMLSATAVTDKQMLPLDFALLNE